MCRPEMCTLGKVLDLCLGKTLIFVLVAWNKPEAPGSITYSACFCLHPSLQLLFVPLLAVGHWEVASSICFMVGSVAQTVQEWACQLNLNRTPFYILLNSFSFPVHRQILDALAGKAWNLGFSSGFATGPWCSPGYLPILPFVCFDLSRFKLSIVQSISCIVFVSYPAQQGPDLIGNLIWHQYFISDRYTTHQFSLLFTASSPNIRMSQNPDCWGWDKLVVLLKQVSRGSVLKKMLGLCCKGWQQGAESECRVCRVARREHLCVVLARKKTQSLPLLTATGLGVKRNRSQEENGCFEERFPPHT